MLCLNERPGRNVEYWHTLGQRPATSGARIGRGGRPLWWAKRRRPMTSPAGEQLSRDATMGRDGFEPRPPEPLSGRFATDGFAGREHRMLSIARPRSVPTPQPDWHPEDDRLSESSESSAEAPPPAPPQLPWMDRGDDPASGRGAEPESDGDSDRKSVV